MFEGVDHDNVLWKGLETLLKQPSFIIQNGKVRRRDERFGFTLNGPWIFIRGIGCRQCYKWGTYQANWKFVPEYCWTKCWKVVVRLDTLVELHQLYNIAVAYNIPGKVGINKRTYVKGPYLGFFYSQSEEEAKAQKELLIQNLDSMDVKYDIIHKQMCTEFTAAKSQPNPILEKKLDEIFSNIEDETFQPAWLKSAIMWEWNNFANAIGDPTATDKTVKCAAKE